MIDMMEMFIVNWKTEKSNIHASESRARTSFSMVFWNLTESDGAATYRIAPKTCLKQFATNTVALTHSMK